jgi:hypothetical protein
MPIPVKLAVRVLELIEPLDIEDLKIRRIRWMGVQIDFQIFFLR